VKLTWNPPRRRVSGRGRRSVVGIDDDLILDLDPHFLILNQTHFYLSIDLRLIFQNRCVLMGD
jgi:hypothetical protein